MKHIISATSISIDTSKDVAKRIFAHLRNMGIFNDKLLSEIAVETIINKIQDVLES